MASASAYQAAAQANSPHSKSAFLPMQKKVFENVLECIVQLKSEFFEKQEPITDDSIVLQRFCAKFEHFIQIGMKEKVSLLGRKKDYWDYFCDCLGAAKGINDGIKYVKSLGENKTSLGRGRAFIRFCLVHQRLADTIQQCTVNAKTHDWFIPGTLMTDSSECQRLISALYDLNSLHFDLSPRGYDLDASWPAFANRKAAGSGAWNVPISRRSSMTSMDSVGLSIDNSSEMDRLARDLEVAQTAKSDLVGQIGALQHEKTQVSQSAWATQGELAAIQQQLKELQEQHGQLQAKHQELDVSHVKLKLEKEHLEKCHTDEVRTMQAKFEEEQSRRVSQLRAEEEMWKRERKEEAARLQREVDRLSAQAETDGKRAEEEQARCEEQSRLLRELLVEADVNAENGDFRTSISSLGQCLKTWQHKMSEASKEKSDVQTHLQVELTDKGQKISLLEGRLLEQERALKEFQESSVTSQAKSTTLELELKAERDKNLTLAEEKRDLENGMNDSNTKVKVQEKECDQLKTQVRELELRNESLLTERDYLKVGTEKTDALSSEIKGQLEATKAELASLQEESKRNSSEMKQKMDDLSANLESEKEKSKDLQKNLIEKEEESNNWKKTAEGELETLKSLVKQKEEEISEWKGKLEEVTSKLTVVSTEAAEVAEGSLVLTEKLALSEAEVETLRSGYRDVEGKVIDLEREVEKMIEELRERDIILAEANSQSSILNDEIEEKTKVLDSVRSQMEKLSQELKVSKEEKESAVSASKSELTAMMADREQLRRDMDVEKTRLLGLLEESEGVKRSESEKEEKISSLILEMERLRQEKDSEVNQIEDRARLLNSQINEKDSTISDLSKEIDGLRSEIEEERKKNNVLGSKTEQIDSLGAKLKASENKFTDMITRMDAQQAEERLRHENEVASFTDRIKYLEKQTQEREKFHNTSCMDYENKIMELKTEKDSLIQAYQDGSETLEKLTTEITLLKEGKELLEVKVESDETDRAQTEVQMAELKEQLASMKSELEATETERNSFITQVDTMAEELTRVEDSRDELQRSVEEMKEQLRAAEDEAQEKLAQKREVELKVEETESKLLEAKSALGEMAAQVKKAESKIEENELLQQSVQSSQFSSQVLEESLMEARKALEEVRAERSALQEKHDKQSEQREAMQTRINDLESDQRDMMDKLESMASQMTTSKQSEAEKLNKQLEEEKRKSRMTIETLHEEISALQFQLSAEQMQQSEIQGHIAAETEERIKGELRSRVSEQEIVIEKLEQELEAACRANESENLQASSLEKKLNKSQESLASAEKRVAQSSSRLEEELLARQKLETELTSLRETFSRSLEDKTAMIKNLESDNAQYRKKLVKLVKEKDSLWQQTDRLVDAQKRKSEERWQDNAEVTHCPSCKTEFSLFVRKHHCRLCGKIYCWSCSDFWLDSTLSSKKVRCCKECFESHDKESSQLSSSMINNNSDDDDEEEEEGDVGSETRSSRSDSVARAGVEGSDMASTSSIGSSRHGLLSTSDNQTDDGKVLQSRTGTSQRTTSGMDDNDEDNTDGNVYDDYSDEVAHGGAEHRSHTQQDADNGDEFESNFQVVSQEEIEKSISQYSTERKNSANVPSNMTSSMILSAEELESGEVNQQNEVWIKPGKTYVVPVDIEREDTVLHWSFTSKPKDIVFSVTYRADESVELDQAEEIVTPCKCDSHKQTVRGELTAKQAGIYSLVFDNTYSRLTSKQVHYRLEYTN